MKTREEIMLGIATRIRDARGKKSRAKLSGESGVSSTMIAFVERQQRCPSAVVLYRLCKALHLSADSVLELDQ